MHRGVEIPNSYSGLIALESASGTAGPLRRPGTIDCVRYKWADILCLCVRSTSSWCNRKTLSEKSRLDVSNLSNQPWCGFFFTSTICADGGDGLMGIDAGKCPQNDGIRAGGGITSGAESDIVGPIVEAIIKARFGSDERAQWVEHVLGLPRWLERGCRVECCEGFQRSRPACVLDDGAVTLNGVF